MTKPFEIPKALVWKAFQRVKANGGERRDRSGIDRRIRGTSAATCTSFESKWPPAAIFRRR